MTSQQWKDLVYNHYDKESLDGQMMRTLAYLPDLMTRGRAALRTSLMSCSSLHELQQEARSLHDSFAICLDSLRGRWKHMDLSAFDSPLMRSIFQSHFSRSYGMGLCTRIILNCIIMGLEGDDGTLRQESSRAADEILTLAEVANQHRPLGAIYILICLAAAWVASTDLRRKDTIMEMYLDYQKDVQGPSATTSVEDLRWLERRFYLRS